MKCIYAKNIEKYSGILVCTHPKKTNHYCITDGCKYKNFKEK